MMQKVTFLVHVLASLLPAPHRMESHSHPADVVDHQKFKNISDICPFPKFNETCNLGDKDFKNRYCRHPDQYCYRHQPSHSSLDDCRRCDEVCVSPDPFNSCSKRCPWYQYNQCLTTKIGDEYVLIPRKGLADIINTHNTSERSVDVSLFVGIIFLSLLSGIGLGCLVMYFGLKRYGSQATHQDGERNQLLYVAATQEVETQTEVIDQSVIERNVEDASSLSQAESNGHIPKPTSVKSKSELLMRQKSAPLAAERERNVSRNAHPQTAPVILTKGSASGSRSQSSLPDNVYCDKFPEQVVGEDSATNSETHAKTLGDSPMDNLQRATSSTTESSKQYSLKGPTDDKKPTQVKDTSDHKPPYI